jgi:hypothetical protein
MRAPWIFHLGLAVDGIILVAAAGNLLVMQFAFSDAMPAEGLTGIGYAALWLIPLALMALIVTAYRLKSAGKLLAANVLLWVPALPLAASLLLWVGLAGVFILFGK